jgi:hypothetical protein
VAEINLGSTGADKGLYHFLGSKIGKHLQLCGRAHYRATRKNLESRKQLDEADERDSGGDSLLLYKILHLLFFPLVRILCALPQFESILDGHLSSSSTSSLLS